MFASFNARALGLTLDAATSIQIAKKAGYAGVDLLVRDITDPHSLRFMMDDLGLRGGAWTFPFSWRGDEASYFEGLRQLPQWAKTAEVLGLTRTCTWVMPFLPDWSNDDNPQVVLDWHKQRLQPIIRVLADHGVFLGLEAVAPRTPPFASAKPDFVRSLNSLNRWFRDFVFEHANVGVLWDSFHAAVANDPFNAGLLWGADRVVWAHVANPPLEIDQHQLLDTDRLWPDQGECAWTIAMLKNLSMTDYLGPVTPEPFGNQAAKVFREGTEPEIYALRVRQSLDRVWPHPTATVTVTESITTRTI